MDCGLCEKNNIDPIGYIYDFCFCGKCSQIILNSSNQLKDAYNEVELDKLNKEMRIKMVQLYLYTIFLSLKK